MSTDAEGVFDRLGRITATAAERGVEVRVNLEGRLIGLDLGAEAMALEPHELAAEIFRLAHGAAAAALSDGLAALAPIAGPELTAELTEIIAARPRPTVPDAADIADARDTPARPRTLDEHEDFSSLDSWALPR